MPEPITPTPVAPEPAPTTDPTPTAPVDGTTPPTSTPQAPASPPTPVRPDGVSDTEWSALGDPGKAALVRERAASAQAVAELAALRKQIDDANKSAEQRAADDLKAAQEAAAANAAKALRYEVAAEAGIPLALAARLTGSTREEIAADAETFKTLIPAGATPPRTPAPDPGQGPRPIEPDPDAEYQQYAASMKLPSVRK